MLTVLIQRLNEYRPPVRKQRTTSEDNEDEEEELCITITEEVDITVITSPFSSAPASPLPTSLLFLSMFLFNIINVAEEFHGSEINGSIGAVESEQPAYLQSFILFFTSSSYSTCRQDPSILGQGISPPPSFSLCLSCFNCYVKQNGFSGVLELRERIEKCFLRLQ